MTLEQMRFLRPGAQIRLLSAEDIIKAREVFRLRRPRGFLARLLSPRERIVLAHWIGYGLEYDLTCPRAESYAWIRVKHTPGEDRPGIPVHHDDFELTD
ncbi:hypothetical protein LCGC14_1270120 [marine sediment metagenome]|uniref:Uncharacterized protein n=1 Tax=marine sediment metagenome TaxID=412755 RepID=A0A0F9KYC4_9ZZZZ